MKTVKELSEQLGVSKVTIYNHINKLGKEITGNVQKKKSITYLNDEGIMQIKISMGLLDLPTIRENISTNQMVDNISLAVAEQVTNNISTDINEIKEQLEDLKEQNKLLMAMLEKKPFFERFKKGL